MPFAGPNTIEDLILIILALVVIIIFWGAIYAFVVAIFQLIFSKWDWEKIKKAWNNIRYMLLWVILSIILLFIAPLLFQILQIPGYEVYTAENIFDKAIEIFEIVIEAIQQWAVEEAPAPSSWPWWGGGL